MATTYTAVSTNGHTKNLSLPNDGEANAASTVNTNFESLADNDAWIIESYYTVPLVLAFNASSEWTVTNASNRVYFVQNTVAGTDEIWIPLQLLAGSSLDGIKVTCDGGAGHVGLPVNLPEVDIIACNAASGTVVGGPETDPSGTLVAYEQEHEIVISGAGHTIDETNAYFVRIRGESGTNSLTNRFAVHAIAIQVDMP